MRFEDVRWGITACELRESCRADAALLFDDTPACVTCTDELLERWRVMAEFPGMVLGPWDAGADGSPGRLP